MKTEMSVQKRNGNMETVSFDKILNRIKALGNHVVPSLDHINYTELVMKVIDQMYDGITTTKLDELSSQQSASMSTIHQDYGALAGRILVSNHHKNTNIKFSEVSKMLYDFVDYNGKHKPLLDESYYKCTQEYASVYDEMLIHDNDYLIDYFGFKTLERAYLMRLNNVIVERPQHLWMRVAVFLHRDNIEKVKETYEALSNKLFIHATPTLFNAGTPRSQMSSCYLLAMEDDSIEGIYNTLKDCAMISKWAGGIGLHIHNVRATGSHIRGTNGTSNGIVPMLKVFNHTARYVDQGGGKRNGSFAMYIEPWHADIMDFIELRKNHGDEEMKARDLFYALWIPDLFMKRVKANANWTLMCPDKCPFLSNVYGEEFEALYEKYENENLGERTIPARQLWFSILDSQIETGTPYMLYKDACNKKSNQKNLGTIKSSNLCTEIIEYSDKDESAVCNLASIGLPKYVKPCETSYIDRVIVYTKTDCVYCKLAKALLKEHDVVFEEIILDDPQERQRVFQTINDSLTVKVNTVPQIYMNETHVGGYMELMDVLRPQFDFETLHSVTKMVTSNLNKIIDMNFYPTKKTRRSNMRHRPIGIGVQGLADVYAMMNYSFDSEEAKQLNRDIFETIYHASLEESMKIAHDRCESIYMLKTCYHSSWHFNDLDNDSTEYVVDTNVDQSIQTLLDTYKPTFDEISQLDGTYLGAYSSFQGSPLSEGKLQFDLWNVEPSTRYDWNNLRENIVRYGTRNSLLLAPMPTASTSQILGNNECFEPFTNNIYVRRTIAGEFVIVNKHLMKDMNNMDMWSVDMKNNIVQNRGSIQHITSIPKYIRDKYRTVWEISMKSLIDMSKDRGAYICQSQSLNLWMQDPTYDKLTNMHFYAWNAGLKTGIYYLRTQAKAAPQQFTVDPNAPCESCSA